MKASKFKSKTAWVEKMNKPLYPVVKEAPKEWVERFGGHRMLIPTPRAIEEIVRDIPKGKLLTVSDLRNRLAKKYNADFSCPLTTGIFLRILSEFSEEQRNEKEKNIAPYWRIIKDDGSLLEKIHGGQEHHAELLQSENFGLLQAGKNKFRVKDYKDHLI